MGFVGGNSNMFCHLPPGNDRVGEKPPTIGFVCCVYVVFFFHFVAPVV